MRSILRGMGELRRCEESEVREHGRHRVLINNEKTASPDMSGADPRSRWGVETILRDARGSSGGVREVTDVINDLDTGGS